MLKRFLSAFLLMPIAVAGFAAQLTATLQSGDKLTPFYGVDAFKDALAAAVDGDVITLSPGVFNSSEITKSVSIIGACAFSGDDAKDTRFNSMTVSADNVTIEGVRLYSSTLTIKGADQLTLNRCYISVLEDAEKEGHTYHNNTILTDCYVAKFDAMSLSQNAVLRNCYIYRFFDINTTTNPALIENCNIPCFAFSYNDVLKSDYKRPYAIYRNCILGFYSCSDDYSPSVVFSSPSEFHNNLLALSYDYYNSISNTPWVISFGSCVTSNNSRNSFWGYSYAEPYRYNSFEPDGACGPQNHKEYPAIPAITSSEIDTQTDAEGVIHVKITATARD